MEYLKSNDKKKTTANIFSPLTSLRLAPILEIRRAQMELLSTKRRKTTKNETERMCVSKMSAKQVVYINNLDAM